MDDRAEQISRLRQARARAGLTQFQASLRLGVSPRTYQKMESLREATPVRRAYLVALEAEPAATS